MKSAAWPGAFFRSDTVSPGCAVRERKYVAMKTQIMKAVGAIGSAGALTLLCLIDTGGAASASPHRRSPRMLFPSPH
jgi:hypothetical protein